MKKKLFFLVVILCSFMSCSRLDLAVNLANSYLTNKTDNFFDLNKEQTKWLRNALETDIGRVKKTILPQLATELRKISEVIGSTRTFDAATVLLSYQRLENLFYQGLRLFAPNAVIFADKITSKQIGYFKEEFDKKVAELRERPEKKSFERMKKHFDSWMGTLTKNQKKDLREFIDRNPPPISETIRHREALVQEFIKTYPDKKTRKKFVEKLFTQYESMKSPTYTKVINEKNRKVAEFVTKILNGMTEDQRNTLIETLRDRANQLIKISKD